MEKQNLTLALPKDRLRKAKVIAVDRRLSLSGFLTQLLSETVRNKEEYELARRRSLDRMHQGMTLARMV